MPRSVQFFVSQFCREGCEGGEGGEGREGREGFEGFEVKSEVYDDLAKVPVERPT